MKKPTNEPPIDDLFARKLGNASLPPSPDGFARLQSRLGQRGPEARLVFWRNPAVYGYAAAAACLLLVFLFGARYGSGPDKVPGEGPVAVNQVTRPSAQKPAPTTDSAAADAHLNANSPTPDITIPNPDQLAALDKATKTTESKPKVYGNPAAQMDRPAVKAIPAPDNEPVLARSKNDTKEAVPPVSTSAVGALAQNAPKPAPPAERVLIVTIAEPAALVAARQAVANAEPEPAVARADQPDKNDQPTNLTKFWRQVKRVKRGEVFARQDSNDERGLLNRAYSGLKQSFEKDKPARQ